MPCPFSGQWFVHGAAFVMSTSCRWPDMPIMRPLTFETQSTVASL